MPEPNKKTPIFHLLGIIFLLVVVDIFSKAMVRYFLRPGDRISLIGDFLQVRYVQNYSGFSWWVPEVPSWVGFMFSGILVIILLWATPVYLFYTHTIQQSIWADIAYIGILSGCLSRLISDLLSPYTTDFIQVLGSPSANFADLFAYCGIFVMVIEIVQGTISHKGRDGETEGFLKRMTSTRKDFFNYLLGWFRSRRDS